MASASMAASIFVVAGLCFGGRGFVEFRAFRVFFWGPSWVRRALGILAFLSAFRAHKGMDRV